MQRWRIEQIGWNKFDRSKVDPSIVPLIKAAALVERNSRDYALYLRNVFHDDPSFAAAADEWAEEEVQHGDALGQWAKMVDSDWDFAAAFARFRAGYRVAVDAETSVRGSRVGELIARCMVETGTSSYYSALAEATEEPALREICQRIAADEFRHYKLFYDHMRRYLSHERIGSFGRLRIALGRLGESEDDELAFAWHCANEPGANEPGANEPGANEPGANEPEAIAYDRRRCIAAYGARAMDCYRPRHVDRMTVMMLRAVGLPARGRLSDLSAWLAWRTLQWRRRRFAGIVKSPTFKSPTFKSPTFKSSATTGASPP